MRTSQTSACRPELRRVARRAPVQNVNKIQRGRPRHRRRSIVGWIFEVVGWVLLVAGVVSLAGVFGFFIPILLEAVR